MTHSQRVGFAHHAMVLAHVLHENMMNRSGVVGKLYSLCYEAMASTWDAVDLEMRLSNYSAYSEVQLAWDIWLIFDSVVMPR
jgi:hypothetical protein